VNQVFTVGTADGIAIVIASDEEEALQLAKADELHGSFVRAASKPEVAMISPDKMPKGVCKWVSTRGIL
jgi:hypothetical protein